MILVKEITYFYNEILIELMFKANFFRATEFELENH